MKTHCGHLSDRSFTNSHDGLCRKCHSNYIFVTELESRHGEDALVQYWCAMVLANLYSGGENSQTANCLIDHLVEFYQRKLVSFPSKERYIRKMIYMLNSLRQPFDIDSMK